LRLLLQIKAERAKRFLGFFHCANRNANCQPGVGRRLGHGKAVIASAWSYLNTRCRMAIQSAVESGGTGHQAFGSRSRFMVNSILSDCSLRQLSTSV
jgi:hypothetical protein